MALSDLQEQLGTSMCKFGAFVAFFAASERLISRRSSARERWTQASVFCIRVLYGPDFPEF